MMIAGQRNVWSIEKMYLPYKYPKLYGPICKGKPKMTLLEVVN